MVKIKLDIVATNPATNTKDGTMNLSKDFFLNIAIPPHIMVSLYLVYIILQKNATLFD